MSFTILDQKVGSANSRHAQLDAFDFPPSLENLYFIRNGVSANKILCVSLCFCIFCLKSNHFSQNQICHDFDAENEKIISFTAMCYRKKDIF
jgi:hypothetical protein